MSSYRHFAVWALLVGATSLAVAQTQKAAQPLTEEQVARMVELKLKDAVVVSAIEKRGVAFTVDGAAIERLKSAKVPDAVLDAIRKAGTPKSQAKPVTYQDVVDLLTSGVPEPDILK